MVQVLISSTLYLFTQIHTHIYIYVFVQIMYHIQAHMHRHANTHTYIQTFEELKWPNYNIPIMRHSRVRARSFPTNHWNPFHGGLPPTVGLHSSEGWRENIYNLKKYYICVKLQQCNCACAKLWAVLWIQSSPEPICRGGRKQGQAQPVWKKRISWNPAEMGETWQETEKNLFGTWCERISGQQSEKITYSLYIIVISDS